MNDLDNINASEIIEGSSNRSDTSKLEATTAELVKLREFTREVRLPFPILFQKVDDTS